MQNRTQDGHLLISLCVYCWEPEGFIQTRPAPVHSLTHICAAAAAAAAAGGARGGRGGRGGCTPQKTPNQDFCSCPARSLCMSLCASLCSVPTVALKAAMIDFFFFSTLSLVQ